MRSAFHLALVLAALSPLAACGGSGDDTGDDTTYDCSMETRADTFVVGLEKVGANGLHFKLMQSTPAPPSRGDNDWTIEISDTAGAPVTGSTLTVVPFMPDHGHGTSVQVQIHESVTTPGDYDANPVNLWMPGLWQTTVSKMNGNTAVDSAMFSFCIPG